MKTVFLMQKYKGRIHSFIKKIWKRRKKPQPVQHDYQDDTIPIKQYPRDVSPGDDASPTTTSWCPICLNPPGEKKLTTYTCGHFMHSTCSRGWEKEFSFEICEVTVIEETQYDIDGNSSTTFDRYSLPRTLTMGGDCPICRKMLRAVNS